MTKYTTITIESEIKNYLDTLKIHKRQTYNELIGDLCKLRMEQNK